MIEPAFVRTMADYNLEMNRRIYAAAARLPDEERRADRGAFWRSIHGTLNHLLWADRLWMSRLAGWPRPTVGGAESAGLVDAFDDLSQQRQDADTGICAWAGTLTKADIDGELRWHSGVLHKDVALPKGLVLVNVFNHQTHHRGQVHALITRAGERTGDTDLWMLVPEPA